MTTSDTPEFMTHERIMTGEEYVSYSDYLLLKKERDEAREELEEYRSIAENIGAEKAISEKEKAIRERDEWAAMCGRYKQERDELLNEIKRLRLDAQREAEHHDSMVKELEGLYDKLKS